MLYRQPNSVQRYHPDQLMTGRCQICKTVVECRAREATPPTDGQRLTEQRGMLFADLYSTECPQCLATSKAVPPAGTRVVLTPRRTY